MTFNVSIVSQAFSVYGSILEFHCGFMDGDDDDNIVNSTLVSVLLQDGEGPIVYIHYTVYTYDYISYSSTYV